MARNRPEALDALGRALSINPDNQKAKQWIDRLSPAKKPSAADGNGRPAAPAIPTSKPEPATEPQARAAAAAVVPGTSAQPSEPPQKQPAPVLAPVQIPPAEQDDPIRDMLRAKHGAPDDTPAQQEQVVEKQNLDADEAEPAPKPRTEATEETEQVVAEKRSAEADRAEPSGTEQETATSERTAKDAAIAEETAAQQESAQAVEEKSADENTAATPLRPVSQQTCLLCSKQSLNEGVCSFCRAVGDLSMLDDISRNESVDRAVMMQAVERFRRELEAGPSFEANLGLALAYLNLKQSNDALPRLAEASRLQPGNSKLKQHLERLRARRLILVVDDSKTVQKMIAGVLEKRLYRVALAEDGLQALARLDDETPSLILLDITMPRMDGYQVAKIITGNDATAAIPVVMLSGKDGFFDRIRGKMAGARGYVTKPFDPDELTGTIERCLTE